MISESIVDNPTEAAVSFVSEAFDLFLKALGVEDEGFKTLNDVLRKVGMSFDEDGGM
jgi:hypothetical protein